MKRSLMVGLVFCVGFFLFACQPVAATLEQPTITTAQNPTQATPEPETKTPQITPGILTLPLSTEGTYLPLQATTTIDMIPMWTKPGYLFQMSMQLPINQKVSVLGRAPGDGWVYIAVDENRQGWLQTFALSIDGLLIDVPEIIPEGTEMLKGHVYTPNRTPATFITVMVNPENAVDTSQQDVAITNAFGEWTIFMPPGTVGTWTVVANDWSCESNTANSKCGLIGSFPAALTFQLPQIEPGWVDIYMLP
jgi:hypothetical protein